MAVNPLIALQTKSPVSSFSNILTNVGEIEKQKQIREEAPARQQLMQAQADVATSKVPTAIEEFSREDLAVNKSIADISRQIIPDLQAGKTDAVAQKLQDRLVSLREKGINTTNTEKAIEMLQTNPEELLRGSRNAVAVDEGLNRPATTDTVQSSKQLPGGLVQLVMKSGEVKVVPPEEANEALIKASERRGAELQGLRAGERGEAKESTKASATAFKGLTAVRKNITNMNEGIKLLEGGARTGAVQGKLPSFKAASIKLDNLRNRLGLDVIGGTTFGALSESELAFALGTALPTGLDEKELLSWMTEKRDAQMKVAANLEEAAIFLGEPGNTVADFIKLKKQKRDAPPSATVGRFQVEVLP